MSMETISIYAVGLSASNPGPATISVQINAADGRALHDISQSIGNATDDFAAYQAVASGLLAAAQICGGKTVDMRFELRLKNKSVKEQLSAEAQIDNPGLVPLFIEIHNLRVAQFPNLVFAYLE